MLFKRKVLHGEKLGRQLGFPTVNFHVGHFGGHYEPGIYACTIKLKRSEVSGQRSAKSQLKKLTPHHSSLSTYKGALYFGPKGKGKDVLEIHILDFSGDLYGQMVSFEVGKKIRPPEVYQSLDALKKAIAKDIQAIKGLTEHPKRHSRT